jgi:peptidoglycan-N-acetylglucosamine deacetylase
MKSCSIIRAVAGTGLVASFMLMQGCSYFGGETPPEQPPEVPPTTEVPPPVVEPEPEIKVVPATTAYKVISGVAARYGLRWQDVVAVNPGITPNKIRVGQTIQLPGQVDLSKCVVAPKKSTGPKVTAPKTTAPKGAKAPTGPGTTYVVKSGDTLGGIAYRHGVKVAAIRSANNMTSDKLSVGQKLTVPAGTKKAAPEVKVAEPKVSAPVTEPTTTAPVVAPVVEPVAPPPVDTNTTVAPTTTSTVAPVAPVAPVNTQTYTVKEGEDLYAVAIRWGVSPSDLKALNNLTSTDLKAGMVLQIPASAQ